MHTVSVRVRKQSLSITVPLLISVFVTCFLLFIDEGAYNFNWMGNWGNWFVFFVYATILLMAQLIVQLLFFKNYKGWVKHMAIALTGLPLGILLAIALFWFWISVNS